MNNQENEHGKSGNGAQQTVIAGLIRSWSRLTTDEQKAVLAVLALFLLGLAVRIWHLNISA